MSPPSRRTPRSSGRAPADRRRPASRGTAPEKARSAPSGAARKGTTTNRATRSKAGAKSATAKSATAKSATARRRPRPRTPAKAAPRRGSRPGRRIAAGLAVSFVLVLVLLVGVFPTRQWLDQRDDLRERQDELARQQEQQDQLEQRISVLQTDEEVERMARDEFGMVRPGEDPYRVLPPPVPAVELPDIWPFTGADDWLNR